MTLHFSTKTQNTFLQTQQATSIVEYPLLKLNFMTKTYHSFY